MWFFLWKTLFLYLYFCGGMRWTEYTKFLAALLRLSELAGLSALCFLWEPKAAAPLWLLRDGVCPEMQHPFKNFGFCFILYHFPWRFWWESRIGRRSFEYFQDIWCKSFSKLHPMLVELHLLLLLWLLIIATFCGPSFPFSNCEADWVCVLRALFLLVSMTRYCCYWLFLQ